MILQLMSGEVTMRSILIATMMISPAFAQTQGPTENLAQQCIADVQSRNNCRNTNLQTVRIVDRRVTPSEAEVIVEVDLNVSSGFDGSCSQASLICTGTCWDMDPAKVAVKSGDFGSKYFFPGQGLRVHKSLLFQKWESGWRCATTDMKPVTAAFYLKSNITVPPPVPAPASSVPYDAPQMIDCETSSGIIMTTQAGCVELRKKR